MFELRLPPEYEVALYQAYEKELLKRCALHRVTTTGTARPSFTDQLLLVVGDTLITVGQRLRARSVPAGLATG